MVVSSLSCYNHFYTSKSILPRHNCGRLVVSPDRPPVVWIFYGKQIPHPERKTNHDHKDSPFPSYPHRALERDSKSSQINPHDKRPHEKGCSSAFRRSLLPATPRRLGRDFTKLPSRPPGHPDRSNPKYTKRASPPSLPPPDDQPSTSSPAIPNTRSTPHSFIPGQQGLGNPI